MTFSNVVEDVIVKVIVKVFPDGFVATLNRIATDVKELRDALRQHEEHIINIVVPIRDDVAALKTSVQDIRQFLELDSPTLSEADQKTLDQIKDEAQQVRTQAEGIDTAAPPSLPISPNTL